MISGDVTITSSSNAEDVNTGDTNFTYESEGSTTGDSDFVYEFSDNINTKETPVPADKSVDNGHQSSCEKRKTVSVSKRNTKYKNTTKPKKKINNPKKTSIHKAKAKGKPSSSATAYEKRDGDPNWKNIRRTFTSPNSNTPFLEDSGPRRSTFHAKSPIQFLFLFFTKEVIRIIVTQTNLYQRQSTSARPSNMQWTDVSEEEIMAFLGVVMAMGIVNLPELDDYWATCAITSLPWFPSIF